MRRGVGYILFARRMIGFLMGRREIRMVRSGLVSRLMDIIYCNRT